jgi:c-di-GMP-binding flagellar brake protein YcgR
VSEREEAPDGPLRYPAAGTTLSLLFDYRDMPWIERAAVASADERGLDLVRDDAGALDVLLSCERVDAMYGVDDGVMRWTLTPKAEGASGPMLAAVGPPSRGERRGFVRASLPLEVRLPGARPSRAGSDSDDASEATPWQRVDADLSATGIRLTVPKGARLRGRVAVHLRPCDSEGAGGFIEVQARVVRSATTDEGCELACAYDSIDAGAQQRVMGWVHAARAAALSDRA